MKKRREETNSSLLEKRLSSSEGRIVTMRVFEEVEVKQEMERIYSTAKE